MPKNWYATGYLGHHVDELEAMRESLGAVVVDIRFKPLSRLPMWRQSAMVRYFGANYLWCQDWGSPNFKNGPPHTMLDLDAGWELVSRIGLPVILLCACRDKETCHRRPLSEWLIRQHGIVVSELEW